MDMKEKLIEVFMHLDRHIQNRDEYGICYTSDFVEAVEDVLEMLKNPNNVGDKPSPTATGWISVKDERKPKQLQECLCVCQFDDDAKGEWRFFNVLKWHDVPYQDNGIVNRPHFTDEGVHGMVVTHWMPLPKLPQPPKGE